MRDYIVTRVSVRGRGYLAAALYEEKRLSLLRLESDREASPVSCIYRGTVENLAPHIGGAFVDIGGPTPCFLPLSRHSHVNASQSILVQVTKEALGKKEPVLTDNIHISGKYAVLCLKPLPLAFSSKLSGEEKRVIRKWIEDDEPGGGSGILVRTNAAGVEKAVLLEELADLRRQLEEVRTAFQRAGKNRLLWKPEPFYTAMLRDLYEKPDRILSDVPSIAGELKEAAGEEVFCDNIGKPFPLPALYGLPGDLEALTRRVVWLRSGAFLVIEQTEAFVSIDVNTGKCKKGRIPEETYRQVNKEAAAEIARQLRLRNLSGIILVDFIKLQSEDHREELLHVMRKLLKPDHIRAEAVDLTPLGIMEIVRQKVRKPLAQTLDLC